MARLLSPERAQARRHAGTSAGTERDMPYAITCRTTTSDGGEHVEDETAADWPAVPAIVGERLTDRLPRLLFGPIVVTIVAMPRPRADLPAVALTCTIPSDDVRRPWREVVAPRVRDFLTHLEADFADRGRPIRVDLRRAPGEPGCHAPWAKPGRLAGRNWR